VWSRRSANQLRGPSVEKVYPAASCRTNPAASAPLRIGAAAVDVGGPLGLSVRPRRLRRYRHADARRTHGRAALHQLSSRQSSAKSYVRSRWWSRGTTSWPKIPRVAALKAAFEKAGADDSGEGALNATPRSIRSSPVVSGTELSRSHTAPKSAILRKRGLSAGSCSARVSGQPPGRPWPKYQPRGT